MYQTQSGVVATFAGIIGVNFGDTTSGSALMPDPGKFSRLGAYVD